MHQDEWGMQWNCLPIKEKRMQLTTKEQKIQLKEEKSNKINKYIQHLIYIAHGVK
jgi:hypothetical protein